MDRGGGGRLAGEFAGKRLLGEQLFDDAGDEGLLGLGGDEAVEGELAGGLGAELEEEAAAVAPVGIDDVDETEPGGAVEVGGVGDRGERDLELAGGEALGDEGDVDGAAVGDGGFGGVDEGREASVAEGVAVDFLVGERNGRRWGWRGGFFGAAVGGGVSRGVSRCVGGGVARWRGLGGGVGGGRGLGGRGGLGGGCGLGGGIELVGGDVLGEAGLGEGFEGGEGLGSLGGGGPFAGEGVGVVVGGIGDGDGLMEVGRGSGELGGGDDVGWDSSTEGGTVGVVIERGVRGRDVAGDLVAAFL